MIICPIFCLFGVVALLTCSSPLTIDGHSTASAEERGAGSESEVLECTSVGVSAKAAGCVAETHSETGPVAASATTLADCIKVSSDDARVGTQRFWALATVLLLQSSAVTAGMVLWPFHLRDIFGFGSEE